MRVITSPQEMQAISAEIRTEGKTIGFVPTMGALHAGHLALVKFARQHCDFLVVSIFVNPLQFGPKEDYKRYPRTPKADFALLKNAKVDVVYCPAAEQMYPRCEKISVVSAGPLAKLLEGAYRPGHFDGMATVVAKLFRQVQPGFAVFGEKDYQQQQIVRQMVRRLKLPVKVVAFPTVREKSGLALSSRNRYLSAAQRRAARVLSQALALARKLHQRGEKDVSLIRQVAIELVRQHPLVKLDYLEIVDAQTLRPVKTLGAMGKARILVAAKVGKTRLIDNAAI